MINYAEIILYNENDDTVSFELSPTQLQAVCKILGLRTGEQSGTITCFSDASVTRMIDYLNRLTLVQEGDGER